MSLIDRFAVSFAASAVLFPLIYPWYVAALLLVLIAAIDDTIRSRGRRSWAVLANLAGIGLAGAWVYLVRFCELSALATYCSVR